MKGLGGSESRQPQTEEGWAEKTGRIASDITHFPQDWLNCFVYSVVFV